MNFSNSLLVLGLNLFLVKSAVILDNDDIDSQGLYSKSDHVKILTQRNFDRKVYGQKQAQLIQFYNSFCGHCRSFAPKYKALASEILPWKNVIQLAVMDCSVEENNEICRQFEIMAYPSLRYFRENFVKANGNIGDKFQPTFTVSLLKEQIIHKLQSEQAAGFLNYAPNLGITLYNSYEDAVSKVPPKTKFVFLIFENENSTTGDEVILDTSDYKNVVVKRTYDRSELASVAGLKYFPGLVGISTKPGLLVPNTLTTISANKENLLRAINSYLKSRNYVVPTTYVQETDNYNIEYDSINHKVKTSDTVYYSDLEKTLKMSLHTEVTRYNKLEGEALQALLDYLDILIATFPARGNLKEYLIELRNKVKSRREWNGADLYNTIKSLEIKHSPVYITNMEYVRCMGSQSKYRGYTCGLWTLFHTLSVSAAKKPGLLGPQVLKSMYGYVKHFFGCTDCSEHFQAMAARNKLFDVKENDKAVLWLWISHNEVNLRLAGDITEDPEYPKIQYPSVDKCPECRLDTGAWNLPAVYQYLLSVYGAENIQGSRRIHSSAAISSPFSNLDIGMLSLLYLLSFIILLLVVKYFYTKRLYRKRHYKLGFGKV